MSSPLSVSIDTPTDILGVKSAGANGAAEGPTISLESSRGTISAPTALVSGDDIGRIDLGGYDGTTWQRGKAYISATASENWDSDSFDTRVDIGTTLGNLTDIGLTVRADSVVDTPWGNTTPSLAIQSNANLTTGGVLMFTNRVAYPPAAQFASHAGSTEASPSATLSGNILGYCGFGGYAAGAFQRDKALVQVKASANWGSGDTSTKIEFHTTPVGSSTPVVRATIASTGTLSMEGRAGIVEVISRTSVILTNTGATTLFTVPAGRICYVTNVLVADPPSSISGHSFDVGYASGTEKVIVQQTGVALDPGRFISLPPSSDAYLGIGNDGDVLSFLNNTAASGKLVTVTILGVVY